MKTGDLIREKTSQDLAIVTEIEPTVLRRGNFVHYICNGEENFDYEDDWEIASESR